ncbi:unnamed protein product [Phaedon cochleariae]|uniref:Uncharacterized protein n=1 Tax=Phaedon cochleariae TaxID=80249 RepID=A0A9N9SDI8_PHACE|nr:unnamed protein product [Phaedon cochleariae]
MTTEKDPVEILLNGQSIKDLPLFSGEPEDWPLFISRFRKTTKACKFTDEKIMIRIQKCLRGRARKTVKPLLISSSNVKTILETLEMMFGRPEIIISMLFEKSKKTPSPRERKPDSNILCSNAVINLITTMEVLESSGHMYNPQLLDEITRKLSYFLKLNWGKYALKNRGNVNLKMFSEWLKEKSEITCYVNYPVLRIEERDNFPHRRETVLSIRKEQNIGERKCILCEGTMHSSEYCKTIKDMNVDERWEIVVKNKLCICCLKQNHFKSNCRKKRYCGSDKCTRIHHPLLYKPFNTAEQVVEHVSDRTQELPSGSKDHY